LSSQRHEVYSLVGRPPAGQLDETQLLPPLPLGVQEFLLLLDPLVASLRPELSVEPVSIPLLLECIWGAGKAGGGSGRPLLSAMMKGMPGTSHFATEDN
jgi:hypothetical protein